MRYDDSSDTIIVGGHSILSADSNPYTFLSQMNANDGSSIRDNGYRLNPSHTGISSLQPDTIFTASGYISACLSLNDGA
jgi:hypothetical protein